jgi:hypothetical protein
MQAPSPVLMYWDRPGFLRILSYQLAKYCRRRGKRKFDLDSLADRGKSRIATTEVWRLIVTGMIHALLILREPRLLHNECKRQVRAAIWTGSSLVSMHWYEKPFTFFYGSLGSYSFGVDRCHLGIIPSFYVLRMLEARLTTTSSAILSIKQISFSWIQSAEKLLTGSTAPLLCCTSLHLLRIGGPLGA